MRPSLLSSRSGTPHYPDGYRWILDSITRWSAQTRGTPLDMLTSRQRGIAAAPYHPQILDWIRQLRLCAKPARPGWCLELLKTYLQNGGWRWWYDKIVRKSGFSTSLLNSVGVMLQENPLILSEYCWDLGWITLLWDLKFEGAIKCIWKISEKEAWGKHGVYLEQ
jgi:hypothetical protein